MIPIPSKKDKNYITNFQKEENKIYIYNGNKISDSLENTIENYEIIISKME